MSITQEYEQIRRDLGEARYQRIEEFLSVRPDLQLNDVYYKPSVFAEFVNYETWITSASNLNLQEIEKRITAEQLSISHLEAQEGMIENEESVVGSSFEAKVSALEVERLRSQARLESLWKIHRGLREQGIDSDQGAGRINRQSPNKDESEMER